MVRPAKPITLQTRNNTRKEKTARLEAEQKLRGTYTKVTAPTGLTPKQKTIFKHILAELEKTDLLSNLDVYILETCVVAIDKIRNAEKIMNTNPLLSDEYKLAIRLRESYTKDFFRCCNELGVISPTARARLSNIATQHEQKATDPVLKILSNEY